MEAKITRAIVEEALKDWLDFAECDVLIVGAVPLG